MALERDIDMKEAFKNKSLLVVIFEIIIIALAIIGFTFATQKIINDRALMQITTGKYQLDYVGDTNVTVGELEPISDKLVDIDTKDHVIRAEFSVRGASSNGNDKLIYDVMLNGMNIDCVLLNEYTKWNLYKNGKLISSGTFSPSFDGAVLTDNMHLTNIQQSLPKYNQDYDKYVFIAWISEACDDLQTCDLIDQSAIIGSKIDMNIFIALYGGAKKKYVRKPNLDSSCANNPVLTDGMIPVTYKNGEWIVADSNNSDSDILWYDYSNSKWANVVVVNSSKYDDIKAGSRINEDDVLAAYVWIPRFRYKLWNVGEQITDSYNAYDNGIEIIFENGLNTINAEVANDKYLTHPAFGDNLKGFWISKYEISSDNDGYKFVSGKESYRNDTIDNYKNIISGLSATYGIDDGEMHMISNLEWGATLYLSHSKYGVCTGDGCLSIDMNETYVSGASKQDSTTRNVYGVYDMAGSASEYVSGSDKVGGATTEVMLPDNNIWYRGLGLTNENGYYLRGGIQKGLFAFGEYEMSGADNSTRSVIIKK